MNPAAPSPSDSSIAQAFREVSTLDALDSEITHSGKIIRRAREIDASAPAAAVGGEQERDWRLGWACSYSGANLYSDDGELQDNSVSPFIDWLHDSAADIGRKIEERARKKATPAAPVGGFVVEIPRHPEPVAERVGDMGEGTKLQLFREDDGDFIVSVMPSGHRIPDLQVQFCVPGSGGGKSSKTWDALCALHYAMHEDAHPQIAASPAAQPSAKDGVRGEAVELTKCCGREECGGECGNEWRGTEWVRKATTAAGLVDGARTVKLDLSVFDTDGDPRRNMIARGWTPPNEVEQCEGAQPECGPVEFHDTEGVPLCRVCWEGLLADSANHPGEQP